MLIKAPEPLPEEPLFRVFLAGSIEMGQATHWQAGVESAFTERDNIVLCDPRRDDWDSSWKQEIGNLQFEEQVNWELAAMEASDLIVMYFAPGTQSPVTLLEMGLHARSGKLVVCCPEGFWRKGNVDIVCRHYGVPQVATLADLIHIIHQKYNTASAS